MQVLELKCSNNTIPPLPMLPLDAMHGRNPVTTETDAAATFHALRIPHARLTPTLNLQMFRSEREREKLDT